MDDLTGQPTTHQLDFLNVVSHELRTPLTVILGNAAMLTDVQTLPEPEEIAVIAREITAEGEQLLALINTILDLSNIEAGKLKLHLKPICAEKIAGEALKAVRPLALKKEIGLVWEGEPLAVSADPARLKQILVHLMENAVKFTEAGRVRTTVDVRGKMARFQVIDTGCGIKPEHQDLIFDMFRQVDGSATRTVPGAGLGLAVTRRLVEMHGGRIRVESRYGEGSAFIFTMPLAPEADHGTAHKPDGLGSFGPENGSQEAR